MLMDVMQFFGTIIGMQCLSDNSEHTAVHFSRSKYIVVCVITICLICVNTKNSKEILIINNYSLY